MVTSTRDYCVAVIATHYFEDLELIREVALDMTSRLDGSRSTLLFLVACSKWAQRSKVKSILEARELRVACCETQPRMYDAVLGFEAAEDETTKEAALLQEARVDRRRGCIIHVHTRTDITVDGSSCKRLYRVEAKPRRSLDIQSRLHVRPDAQQPMP